MKINELITGYQHIGIPTNDIEVSDEFYQKIGFQMIYAVDNDGIPVRFFRCGKILIEVYQNNRAAGQKGAIDHVALEVSDIEQAFEEAKRVGLCIVENGVIHDLPFWENGIRYFCVEGPNKEIIEFLQVL